MKRAAVAAFILLVSCAVHAQEKYPALDDKTQGLHARWDELTASDWPKALAQSGQTCITSYRHFGEARSTCSDGLRSDPGAGMGGSCY